MDKAGYLQNESWLVRHCPILFRRIAAVAMSTVATGLLALNGQLSSLELGALCFLALAFTVVIILLKGSDIAFRLAFCWVVTGMVGGCLLLRLPVSEALQNAIGSEGYLSYILITGPGNGLFGMLPASILIVLAGKYLIGLSVREQWSGETNLTLHAVGFGLVSGVAISILTIGAALAFGGEISPHFNSLSASANAFSNLYEEILLRGLLLVVVCAMFGRWAAILWVSIAFGLIHGLNEKGIFIALTSTLLAFAVIKAGNLWAGWVGHQSADMIIDNILSGG